VRILLRGRHLKHAVVPRLLPNLLSDLVGGVQYLTPDALGSACTIRTILTAHFSRVRNAKGAL
jgi:hypothetical protein